MILGLRRYELLLPRSALVSYSPDDAIQCLRSSTAPITLTLRSAHCHIGVLEDHTLAVSQPVARVVVSPHQKILY